MTWLLYRLWGLILYLTRQQPDKWGQCPWCGFGEEDWEWFMYKPPYFQATAWGSYALSGEPTTHWVEGEQSCPRCRYRWWVQDSD